MSDSNHRTCRGCGAKLTSLNRALDVGGYCGNCAKAIKDPSEGSELPADIGPIEIARDRIGADALRLTLIALTVTACAWLGPLVLDVGDALRTSWLFALAGLILGRFIFLRGGSILTFQRWRIFWSVFVGAYFLVYIPMVILVVAFPNQSILPLRMADAVIFLLACALAYGASMVAVWMQDRSLRAAVCERTSIPAEVLSKANDGEMDEAYSDLEAVARECKGMIAAQDQKAKLHIALGFQHLDAGNRDEALAQFEEARSIDARSEYVQLRTALGLDAAGDHTDALEMLVDLQKQRRDKDIAKEAGRMIKSIKRKSRLVIRCPNCGKALTGTVDMVGDTAVCSKCKAEFTVER